MVRSACLALPFLALACLGCFQSGGSPVDPDAPASEEEPIPLGNLELKLQYTSPSIDSNGLHYLLAPPDSIVDFRLVTGYWYGPDRSVDSLRTLVPDQGRLTLPFKEFKAARSGTGAPLFPGARITPSSASMVRVLDVARSSRGDWFWNGMRDLDAGKGFYLVYVDKPSTVEFDTVGCDGKRVRSVVRFRSAGFYALEASDHPGKPLFKALVLSKNLAYFHGPIGFLEYQKYLAMAKCRDYSAYKEPVLGNWKLDSIGMVQGYRTKYLSLRKDDSVISLEEEEAGGRWENRAQFFVTDSSIIGGYGTGEYFLSKGGDTLHVPGSSAVYVRMMGEIPSTWVHRLRKVRQVEGEFKNITAMAVAGNRLLLVRSLWDRTEVLRLDSTGRHVDSLGVQRDSCLESTRGAAVQDDRILWVNSHCGALRIDLEKGELLPGSFHPQEVDFDSYGGKPILGYASGMLWTLGYQGKITGNAIEGSGIDTTMPHLSTRGEGITLHDGRIYGTFLNVHVRRMELAKDTLSFSTEGAYADMVVRWGESLWILQQNPHVVDVPLNLRPYRLMEYRRPGNRPGEWLPLMPAP